MRWNLGSLSRREPQSSAEGPFRDELLGASGSKIAR